MNSQVLDEEIQWECQRIAAAFGVEEWNVQPSKKVGCTDFAGRVHGFLVTWSVKCQGAKFDGVSVGIDEETRTELAQRGVGAEFFHELMARGLYRLGVSEEELAQMNHSLSSHEKMELRLSLPREFWPKKWLDEEGTKPSLQEQTETSGLTMFNDQN